MPLATTPIRGRRKADDDVSRQFGHCKCSVHSPTQSRPGAIGRHLHKALLGESFKLATSGGCELPALLEVYPHVALLGLAGRSERLPYKAAKTLTYWPRQSAELRKKRLCEEWKAILARLGEHIDGIDLPLPNTPEALSFDHLKRFEDAVDALVCAWMAVQFLDKRAVPLGDHTAGIWIPSCSLQYSKEFYAA
jgi:predicted RNase H-like nuclease